MFGRSKKDKKAQQPQQMQVSPEALALLQAMQAGQQMQQQQMQQQQMQQMMQQQQMQQPQMMQQQMQQPQMMQPPMPAAPAAEQMAMGQMPMAQMPSSQPIMDDDALLAEIGAAPQVNPQMAPQPLAAQSMPTADMTQPQMSAAPQMPTQMNQGQMNPGFAFAPPPDAAMPSEEEPASKKKKQKKPKLSREEKRAIAAQKKQDKEKKSAEKKALAKEKADEKKRAKRRKKLAKTRFSRARYLREANGNAIAAVVLWIFVILLFIVGPFMLNTAVLIPQTNENLRILTELDSLERSIITSRPQITAMVEKRKAKQRQITAFTSSFVPQQQATESFESLATQLEQAGLEIEPVNVRPYPLSATSIMGTSVSIEIKGNYLDWLRVRNKFVRSQTAISIPTESVSINEETGGMEITAQIIIPSSL